MIKLTRLNGTEFVVNMDLIEFIEATPDSVVSTASGKKLIVKESVDEIIDRVIKFKRKIYLTDRVE